jgi:hypothetical protein
MRLANDEQLSNTRRKLANVEEMIRRHQQAPSSHPAREDSLRSLRAFACQLQGEIAEYEATNRPVVARSS